MYVTVSKPRCGWSGAPFALADAVLHLAHLVEQDEWIGDRPLESRERPADREALTLVRLDRAHDALHPTETRPRRDPDGGEGEWVLDGDGGHGALLR